MPDSEDAIKGLIRAIDSAAEQDRPLRRIRVTPLAPEGSIVALPMTPERARATERLRMTPDGIVPDPESERVLEVLIHPGDWMRVLRDPSVRHYTGGGLDSLMGVPVRHG